MSGKLTPKQQLFVDHYFTCGLNATEAARRAGYAHANKQGPALLVNLGIRAEIDRRLDAAAMPANEVLARIADIARGSMADFLNDDGAIDLVQARRNDMLHLIKSRSTTKDGERIELYSKFDALTLLAKQHGLLVDRTELSGPGGGPLLPPIREVVIQRDSPVDPP